MAGQCPAFIMEIMMKRDKNFKLSKETKRYMATIVDPVKRNQFKNAMIQAQIIGAQPYKSEKKNRKEASE
jgi:hypothetical protein